MVDFNTVAFRPGPKPRPSVAQVRVTEDTVRNNGAGNTSYVSPTGRLNVPVLQDRPGADDGKRRHYINTTHRVVYVTDLNGFVRAVKPRPPASTPVGSGLPGFYIVDSYKMERREAYDQLALLRALNGHNPPPTAETQYQLALTKFLERDETDSHMVMFEHTFAVTTAALDETDTMLAQINPRSIYVATTGVCVSYLPPGNSFRHPQTYVVTTAGVVSNMTAAKHNVMMGIEIISNTMQVDPRWIVLMGEITLLQPRVDHTVDTTEYGGCVVIVRRYQPSINHQGHFVILENGEMDVKIIEERLTIEEADLKLKLHTTHEQARRTMDGTYSAENVAKIQADIADRKIEHEQAMQRLKMEADQLTQDYSQKTLALKLENDRQKAEGENALLAVKLDLARVNKEQEELKVKHGELLRAHELLVKEKEAVQLDKTQAHQQKTQESTERTTTSSEKRESWKTIAGGVAAVAVVVAAAVKIYSDTKKKTSSLISGVKDFFIDLFN